MIDAPWLTPEKVRLVNLIFISYQEAFGSSLLACNCSEGNNRTLSQEVFAMRMPLLAHDRSRDPLVTYVNASALLLWHCRWDEMVGMPSRKTAPADQLEERTALLKRASVNSSLIGYRGIRIDSLGREFYIKNARIWTIRTKDGISCGQAATFPSWWFL